MESQEYLNQISAQARPATAPKKSGLAGILSSKFFIFGMISVGALILIMILGAILSSNKGGDKTNSFALKLHLDATSAVIQEYQPLVKSSILRSSSASLSNVLSNTNRELTNYVTEKYSYKDKEVDENLTTAANTAKDALRQDLFVAKINGNLDRVYAHKMAYEITLITTEEAKLINSTKDDTLKELLTKSYTSLDTLYSQFNDFSEASK